MCALQLIQAKNTYLCKAPIIGLKTTPDQLESAFEDVDKLVKEFEMVASCILVGIKSDGCLHFPFPTKILCIFDKIAPSCALIIALLMRMFVA